MDFVPGSHDRVLSPCVVVDDRGHLFVFRWHKRFTPDVQKFLVGTCEPVTRPSSCNEYVMSDTSLAAAASEAMYGPREIAEHLLLYTSPRPVSFNSSSSSTLATLVNGASKSAGASDTIDQNKNTEQLPSSSTDSGEAGEAGAGDVSKVDDGGAADEKRPVMSAKDARLLEILSTASGGKFTISDSSSSIPHVIKNHQQKNDNDEEVDEDDEAAAEPYLVLPTGITADGACAFPTKRDRTLRRLQSLPEELAMSTGSKYSDAEGNDAAVKMVSDEEILKNRTKYALPEVFGKARTFAEMLPRVPEVFRKLLIEMQSATRLRLVLQPRLGTAGRSNESSMHQSITSSASSTSTPNAPAGLHHNAPRPGQPQSRPPAGGPLHRDGQHGTMRSGQTPHAVTSGKGKSSSLTSVKKKQKKKYVECELAHYIVSPSREFLERLLKSDKDLARCVCPPGAADSGTEADDLRFMEITSRAVFGESPTVFADIEKITVGSALDAAVQHNEAMKLRHKKHKHSSEAAMKSSGQNGPNGGGLPSSASSLNGNGNAVHNGDDDDEDDAVVGTNEENTVSKTVYKAEIRNGMLRQFRRIAYNDHGLPIDVQYDFAADTLTETVDDLELRGSTCLRPYQEQSLERFLRGGKARSGIVVLPCGAGKTLTGVAAAVALGKRVLVACINALSVYQWREQFIKWSIVPESEISVCTGKQKDTPKGVFITTYAMLTSKVNVQEGGKMSEDQVQKKLILDAVEKRPWGLLLLDEVHGAPADCFQRVLDRVKAHSVLGLTATLLREDGKIVDLRFLVGPKLYEANWLELTAAGHLAPVDCVEVRCPMPAPVFAAYLKAPNDSHRTDLEVLNPEKMWAAQALVAYHTSKNPPDKVLLFCDSTYAVRVYAEALGVPFMDGQTKHEEREILLSYFRNTDDNGCVDPTDIDEYERRNGATYDDDSRSDAPVSDEDDDGNNYTNDDDATNGADIHQGTSRPKPRSRRPKSRPFKLQNGALFLTSGSGIGGGGGSGGARQRFKKKQVNCIVISRVGDTALDLPMANVVVQVNGLGASRRQEAQRLGRVLRPKPPSSAGGGAFFYTLVSEGTDETAEAFGRQQWLLDQGFAYRVVRSKPDVVDFFVAGDKALRGKFTREDMRLIDAAAAGPAVADELAFNVNAHDGGALCGEYEHGPASQQTRSKRRRDGRTVALNADDQSHLNVEDDSCRFGVFQDRDNSPWARALEALLKSKLLHNSNATTASATAIGARDSGQSPLNLDGGLQSQGGRRGNRPQFTMTEEMADSLMEHYRREAGHLAVTSAFATPAFSFSSSFITALGNSALRGPPALQQLSRQHHLPPPLNQLDESNNHDDDGEIVEVHHQRTRLEISEADFTPDRLASICANRDLRAGRLLPTKSARLIQTAIAELSTTTNPRAPYGDLSRAGLVCAGGPAWQICLPRSAAMRRHGGFRRRGDYDLTKRIITGDVGKRGVDRGVTAVDNFARPSTPTAATNRTNNSHADGGGLTEFERATAAAYHTTDVHNNNNGNGGASFGDSGGLGGGSGRADDSGVPTTAQDDEDATGSVVWEHLPHAVSREIENYFRHGHIDRPLAIKGYGKVTVDPADLPWSHGALSVPAPDDSESDEDGAAGGAASSPTFNSGSDGTVGGATFGGGANPNLGEIGADFVESDETGKGKSRRKKATTSSEASGGPAAKPQLTKQAALTQSGRGQGRGNKRPGYVHPSAPQVEEEHEPTPFEVLQPSERMLAAVRGSATRRLRLRRHDPDHVCDLAAKDSPCVAHLLGMVETRVRGER